MHCIACVPRFNAFIKLFADHITMYGCPEQEIRKVSSVGSTLEDSACSILKVENEKIGNLD